MKIFELLAEKILAGLLKLHSTCPEEHFEDSTSFKKTTIL